MRRHRTTRMMAIPLAGVLALAGCVAVSRGSAERADQTDSAGAEATADEAIRSGERAAGADARATATYEVYVANESADMVSRVAFSPDRGARVVNEVPVGLMPTELDGAHGIKVGPDGRHWYVSLAHGTPYGSVWKFAARADTLVGRVEVGRFPATMSLSPGGDLLFVVNFNLHGDPVPSDVSVVHTPTMTEIARPTTCVMPHGSRIDAAGAVHYSVCMHSDQLVAIDTRTLEVTRRISVAPGREGVLPVDDTGAGTAGGSTSGSATESTDVSGEAAGAACSPTWATPGAGERANRYVYVPCNANDEILEVDVREGRVSRRFATGSAPYNLDLSPDGRRLVATLKGEQAVAVFDVDTGEEIARLGTTEPVTHGVVIGPEGRRAYVTNEAVGSTPGTVDVFDLERLERVASTAVSYQAGGIDGIVRSDPR